MKTEMLSLKVKLKLKANVKKKNLNSIILSPFLRSSLIKKEIKERLNNEWEDSRDGRDFHTRMIGTSGGENRTNGKHNI